MFPTVGKSGSMPIDHACLGRHAQLLCGGGERRINSRLVTVNDDDIGAVTSDQAAQNPCGQFTAFPARVSGYYDTHVHIVAKPQTAG